MQIEAEWVSAIATSVGALAIIFVAFQSYLAKKQLEITVSQFQADHERSRRERAIDVLARWTTTLDKAHPSARTLVEGFDIGQCEKLKTKKGFKISKDKEELVKNVLHGYSENDPLVIENDKLVLHDNHSAHIYYLCITHLNSLEIALQSWLVRVADEDILEQELQYLIKPEKGHYVLENLRAVLGGKDCYPAIDEFVDHIKDMKNGGPGRRARVA